jgi:4-amino-4-deoxy-L-arabinose transferase-like glycosyltransferase
VKPKLTALLKYSLLALLIYMPIFGHLDTLPIRLWDESRLAQNAYEMFKNGNFIVTHFDGKPDMWNTKPPLMIWAQVFFMKVVGVGELAIRLPSAIAALLTCAALMIFAVKFLKNFWLGFISVLVLVTANGYINLHGTRTGDYDALLTLFTTLSGLCFFIFYETKKTKYLYLFFLSTALAVLTKSITGLLFLPALAFYALFQKQIIPTLKNKHFYLGVLGFVALVLSYFFLREWQNQGYIAAVQANDLGGRYLTVIENHTKPFLYYYQNFQTHQFTAWYLFVVAGLAVGLAHKDALLQRLSGFLGLMLFFFLLVISTAKTKLEWYDIPMYPFLAIAVAIFIYFIFDFLKNNEWANTHLKYNVLPFVFLFLMFKNPYHQIWNKTYLPTEDPALNGFYDVTYFLKDALKGKQEVADCLFLFDDYNAHNFFYINILQDKGININYGDWRYLNAGDKAIVSQENVKQYIADNYEYEVLLTYGTAVKYQINGRKE